MKVAVQCESPLLQRSLELFLEGHLSSLKQCDVVLRDFRGGDTNKPVLYVASGGEADIVKPFSRSQLMLAIEKRLKKDKEVDTIAQITAEIERLGDLATSQPAEAAEPAEEGAADSMAALERRIEQLTREYQQNIIEAVRSFYGK